MAYYLEQVAYSTEGWQALAQNPQMRIEAVRLAIEKLGGKIESTWFVAHATQKVYKLLEITFGEYDVVLILQVPDNISAAEIAKVFAEGGACRAIKTTPLITVAEAVEAMKKASTTGYRAATARG